MPKTVAWRPFPTFFWFLAHGFRKSRTTLFEKMDLMRPLRPNRHVENDRILIISLWGFRKKGSLRAENHRFSLAISMFSKQLGVFFFEKPVFHFKPSEASFSWVMCLASRLLENPKWLLENPKWLLENPKGRQIGRRRSAVGGRYFINSGGLLTSGGG